MATNAATDAIEAARSGRGLAWLAAARNADGAWGYRPGRDSYVEPTALALAVLLGAPAEARGASDAVTGAIDWLAGRQRADGGWGVSAADDEPSWMTACAVWSLALARDLLGRADLAPRVAAGAQALLVEREIKPLTAEENAEQRRLITVDPTLVGWSWSPETASWIFPTATSVIAALAADPRNGEAERVRQGLAYLRDRACANGGWNFGNPYMIGQPYAPNVVDTSATLLALAAAGERDGSLVESGRRALAGMLDGTRSALGLGWGALALATRLNDPATERARSRLAALQTEDGSWRRDTFATAVALLALGERSLLAARPGCGVTRA